MMWSVVARRCFASSSSAGSRVLVFVEHDGKNILPATLSAISAASQLSSDVTLLVASGGAGAVVDAASKVKGATRVLFANDGAFEHNVAENLANLIARVHATFGFSHILASASALGKSVLPRVAASMEVQPISEITAIKDESTFVRPIYAGNAVATVRSKDPVKVVTVRSTAFDKAVIGNDANASIEPAPTAQNEPADLGLTKWISAELSKSERPELGSARVIVSGGRALGSGENFKILEALADKLGGAVGASRAAVDAGYVSNDLQIGQTGKVVAPELYVAVGISGAIQHLAGMKDSKTIVAINKDPEAPIFQVADYGLVADLFAAIPELTKRI
ncbi:mitochondrial electron transfer flavoprotein subunit alpha [Andalucia godoyi]|uniref:Electron transfer flavoprotein subunit alpha n=1 Tax=Andalucia godoyi TaxID=505711 RepID=A0A8K0AJS4_ANDGO|nr:mitochondrial electron transfer flavoprotein subunit alpha [Andalucia godoyi]|eukprot:ANDGO_03502.mRNA.1 mitochondrial electron transfer flavoprotein subunit alpha